MESRNTIQRELVLAAVQEIYHPTAEEVYNQIADNHPSISKGTVYRNLGVLVQNGALRKVSLPDGPDRFDITIKDHYHVRCRICGCIDDVDLPYQEDLMLRIRDAHGFVIEDHDILLKGICPKCQSESCPGDKE